MTNKQEKGTVTYKMIAEALFENYESIYDIKLDTKEYRTYYQSDFYQGLKLAKKGEDFFRDLSKGIPRIIAPEDQEYVTKKLNLKELLPGLKKEKYYRIVYRIQSGEQKIYHQIRATFQEADDGMHILMGIRNIDDLVRQQMEHENTVTSMRQKELNYLEAILATSAAYLEANLTQNRVLEKSDSSRDGKKRKILGIPSVQEIPEYDRLQTWIVENLIIKNNEKYKDISSREYLLKSYEKGEKRASVSFAVHTSSKVMQPCRAVFYLYEEQVSCDIHVLCVIYDLTEQQQREQEMEKLEHELRMSRIRNSNSQMHPHFLYNALGSIQEVMLIDPQYASELLGDFTVHLRSCVRAMQNDKLIPFSEELRNIRAYVNIEKMRLGKKLKIIYDIEVMDFYVLPLSIQPLIENAIRHGIHKRGRTGGTVTLRTSEAEDAWIIRVEDTGVGFNAEKIFRETAEGKRDSTGLVNIQFRLEKVVGGSMTISSKIGEGSIVTLRIPREVFHEGNYSR